MLTSEPEWELVSSSAKEMAFDEFPVDETDSILGCSSMRSEGQDEQA